MYSLASYTYIVGFVALIPFGHIIHGTNKREFENIILNSVLLHIQPRKEINFPSIPIPVMIYVQEGTITLF